MLDAPKAFRLYRDATVTTNDAVESPPRALRGAVRTLAEAGIERDELYLAWDFTVASERNLSERMLAIRDDAFTQLGDTNLADLKVEGTAAAVRGRQGHAQPGGRAARAGSRARSPSRAT